MNYRKCLLVVPMLAAACLTTARADDKANDAPGPIDSLSDLQDTAKMAFKLADANNDGFISQKEAVDAGNLIVGGFFFRADANGDGKVTKEEGDQARENLFNQRPLLRFVFQRAEQETANQGQKADLEQAKQNIMNTIDANRDGSLDATELRQAVQTTVQSLFLTADRNGDSQLDPAELNGAAVEVGRAGIQAAFQTADADKNGAVSREEFDKAIITPANIVFRVIDANNDGQITDEELRSGIQILARELKSLQVPEPANSLPNQIQSAVNRTPTNQPAPAAAQPAPAAAQPAPAVVVPRQ
jgi:Ca2+-binding EF-hand superfamily protein